MPKELLDPWNSPQAPGKPGVRRLNNVPLYMVLGVVSAALIITGYVAIQKGKQNKTSLTDDHGGSASLYAAQFVGDREGGVIKARLKPARTPEAVPVLYVAPTPTPNQEADELQGERMRALQEALKSKSTVNDTSLSASKSQIQASSTNLASVKQTLASLKLADPNNFGASGPEDLDNYRQKLAETQLMLRGMNGGTCAPDPNNLSLYASADSPDAPRKDRWKLNTQLEPPSTPYILRTGFVVPALLISAMDSELPGTIIAQVSQNVYDTPTGNYLLIPQGSRLVGVYTNSVGYGQSRVFVAWQRIIYPDGSALDLGAMPGTDQQGASGFHDLTNNHFVRIFGSALLMSAITAGVTWSQGVNNIGYNGFRAGDALSQALGQELGITMSETIRRNMSIAPTLKIRPGYRFNVLVTKDITFEKPYTVPNY
jgi:type IV secretion system protein TrbI